jgi:VWFA-related protein
MKPKGMSARLNAMRFAWVVFGAVVWAQERPELLEPTFRTSTQLVQVDVVVKSKDVPVGGLTKDDFEVFDNNQRQTISVFSVRDAESARPVSRLLPPGVVSNRLPTEAREPVAATVILIDSLNTAPEDQAYARQQIIKYLETAGRNEWVAILHLRTELITLQNFTLDREKLKASLAKWKPTNEYLQMGDGPKITMNGLKIISRHMQGMEGRKKLIWMTSAHLPQMMNDARQGTATIREMYDVKNFNILNAFNAANVAVYPVNPAGLPVGGPGLMDDGLNPMRQLAEATGGKAAYMRNDLSAAIEEAIHDTDLTYTLGFYPAQMDPTGASHSIRVNVKRKDVEMRYRSQYANEVPLPPMNPRQRERQMNVWVQLPLDSTEIPLQAKAVPAPGKPGMYEVSITFDLSAVKLTERNGRFEGSIDLAVVPDIENEKKLKGLRQSVKLSFTADKLAAALEKGGTVKNIVRGLNPKGKPLADTFQVVVMDNATGKAGSVRVPIVVEQAKR